MKHIVKVNNIQEAKDSDIRPIIALDNGGILFFEKKAAGPQIEFVDLGLSVKWGKSLLGATNGDTAESWYGDYYAWGEIEAKVEYNWPNYKYGNGADKNLTKYCNIARYGKDGFTDNLKQLVPEDDAATVINSAWRMPTQAEIEELVALSNEWVDNYNGISGLNGRVFTGKNGNTLFIPAAGYRIRSDINYVGSYCYLWTSTLYSFDPTVAKYLRFKSNEIYILSSDRCFGYSVCPVC